MTIQIKHPFVSLKGDGGDATLVRPSNWNAVHTTSMDTLRILGRLTAGVGSFEELPTSAYMIAALAATDKASLLTALGIGAFTTGDVKWTFDPTASGNGWVLCNGAVTIGNAASTATYAAADALALFVMLYTYCADAQAPVSGGRTGNAVNDFNANKRITVPQLVGRSPIGAGSAAGTTSAWTLGTIFGEENHALSNGELATHNHAVFTYDPGHAHNVAGAAVLAGPNNNNGGGGGSFGAVGNTSGLSTDAVGTGVQVRSAAAGGGTQNITANSGNGTAHNTLHPVVALYAKVKL